MSISSTRAATAPAVYPEPALVVGVGRFGLRVLERLGEDWLDLARCGADPTLGNLRLLQVAPATADGWQAFDSASARLAHLAGASDLPSLALDFVVLRSLGLVRFRDGVYQVALPRDGGVVESRDIARDDAAASRERPRLARRRWFDWRGLGPDPVLAVERLYRLAEGDAELDLFIKPLLQRMRQGHSPAALLATVRRCHALANGRDPSPWAWSRRLHEVVEAHREDDEDGAWHQHEDGAWHRNDGHEDGDEDRAWHRYDDREDGDEDGAWHLRATDATTRALLLGTATPLYAGGGEWTPPPLEEHAPPPISRRAWREFLGGVARGVAPPLEVRLPAPFVPRTGDADAPLRPEELLRVDWQASGWATSAEPGVDFALSADATPFRLGLFDHDGTPRSARGGDDLLVGRLRSLGLLARQGLVRLWIDLQRERVENDVQALDPRLRDAADDALRQSLEVLGELVVGPLSRDATERTRTEGGTDPAQHEPSTLLRGLTVRGARREDPVRQLEHRLAALGVDAAPDDDDVPLARRVALRPDDAHESRTETTGLAALRRAVNRQVRELYDLGHLHSWRDRPVRRPPRLAVFLVGDVGEPFVRAVYRGILRETHAELLRAFGPIFSHFRQGYDRALSIVPVLWTPHPADPFGDLHGESPSATERAAEEAAILDAVQGVRRWVESVIPSARRRVSQIFVGGRVTDTAVLSPDDAVQQTRDFLTFQIRTAQRHDPWLRRTAVAPDGDDMFAAFACREIEFPAETAREALANRLARHLLELLRRARPDETPPSALDAGVFAPPLLDELTAAAAGTIARGARELGERLSGVVTDRLPPATAAPRQRIRQWRQGFDAALEQRLHTDLVAGWRRRVTGRGTMDAHIDDLRVDTARHLERAEGTLRRAADERIEELAGHRGLPSVLAGFDDAAMRGHRQLDEADDTRRRLDAHCAVHAAPDLGPLRSARRAVADAVDAIPDPDAVRFGLLLVAPLAVVAGSHPVRLVLEELRAALAPPPTVDPSTVPEWLVRLDQGLAWLGGPLAPAVGGVLLWLIARALLHRHARRREAVARTRAEALADAAQRTVDATDRPSVRSFLVARAELGGALARRAFADQIVRRLEADRRAAHRIGRAADAASRRLWRRAEELGVRPRLSAGQGPGASLAGRADEDLTHLFGTRESLVRATRLDDYYALRVGDDDELVSLLRELLRRLGTLTGTALDPTLTPGDSAEAGARDVPSWREQAPFTDLDTLLDFTRRRFADLVTAPVAEHHHFGDEAVERLLRFVLRTYPNQGFGAKFRGSEGLDPDGLDVVADAALVLHPELEAPFERRWSGAADGTRTLEIQVASVRPNAAYLLSLAQGIRPHAIGNLRRFESFHDRPHVPDDRTFPLSHEADHGSLNALSVYRDVAAALHESFPDSASTNSDEDGP